MKCKLSKLFFLALIGAISVNGYSQTEEGRKKIVKDYDLKYLNQLAAEFNEEFKESYNKAIEIAKEKKLPINGVNSDGNYFSLQGVDKETGNVLYYQTSNNGTTNSSVQTARAQHLYQNGSLGLNLQGQLMRIGIWDGGIPQASHENLGSNRVTQKDTSTVPAGGQDGVDHATHVAGTMIGNGINVIAARGIAFEGYIWANDWDADFSEMTSQAGEGLLLSNHSYGIGNSQYIDNPGVFGRYTSRSRAVDVITSNAPNYLPVYAAGNDRNGIQGTAGVIPNPNKGGYDILTHESVSKNAVVVAAIEGFTNYTNANAVTMSSFSQWGPTDDFRIKPDISAKGVGVFSSNMPDAVSINSYDSYPGTSMAAPAVTAVFALWQQYFKELNSFEGIENMKAASVKALMAHTASEAGTQLGPDPRFGWGVINAEGGAKVLKDAYSPNPTAVFKELTLENNEEYTLYVSIDGTEDLNVTIAWTDAPASEVSGTDNSSTLLVNDLDLRLYKPNDVSTLTDPLMPYVLTKSFDNPFVIKSDNDVDPIEKINYFNDFDGFPEAGVYMLKVKHKGALVGGQQNFTLIVSGGVVTFSETTASNEDVKFENLKIYPNPTSDFINISADFVTLENAKVSVYDMLGKKVYQNDSLFDFEGEASIDVSNFNAGVYLVEILKDRKAETKKIIIK